MGGGCTLECAAKFRARKSIGSSSIFRIGSRLGERHLTLKHR